MPVRFSRYNSAVSWMRGSISAEASSAATGVFLLSVPAMALVPLILRAEAEPSSELPDRHAVEELEFAPVDHQYVRMMQEDAFRAGKGSRHHKIVGREEREAVPGRPVDALVESADRPIFVRCRIYSTSGCLRARSGPISEVSSVEASSMMRMRIPAPCRNALSTLSAR